jgi:hypothetical protein
MNETLVGVREAAEVDPYLPWKFESVTRVHAFHASRDVACVVSDVSVLCLGDVLSFWATADAYRAVRG